MQKEQTDRAGDGWLKDPRLLYGILAGTFLLVMLSVINAWSQAQPATRSEISQTIANLDPACRPIVSVRMRDRLVREGKPLTRREMEEITSGITSCKDINEQLDGLAEGSRQ